MDSSKGSAAFQDAVTKSLLVTAVLLVATAAKGEWLLYIVCLGKDYMYLTTNPDSVAGYGNSTDKPSGLVNSLGLKDLEIYIASSVILCFATYWGIGIALDLYFYKNRKHKAAEWKCQPDRWLTKSNEWHEFVLGSFNMLIAAVACGGLACHVANGGRHTLYTNISDYGWPYFFVSIPAFFFCNEGLNYYTHRLFHIPWLYRKFHKIHHRYGSPTLYSTTAMHPLESMTFQSLLLIPMFVVPLHAAVYVCTVMYFYYYGMLEHSGIKMESWWPWQPSTLFHDDHHRHFHCNYGVNVVWFDRFHGTLRRKNRVYGEKNFGGAGSPCSEDKMDNEPQYCEY